MFELTINVPSTVYGLLTVEAQVEKGRYHIGRVTRADGTEAPTSAELLEEIETSIDFEMQCARFDALYFAADAPELLAYHA